MRNYWYILVTLAALTIFSGCSDSDSGTLVDAGETVSVLPGDMLIPTSEGTQIKVNDTSGDGNTTVTVISGSARLLN